MERELHWTGKSFGVMFVLNKDVFSEIYRKEKWLLVVGWLCSARFGKQIQKFGITHGCEVGVQ